MPRLILEISPYTDYTTSYVDKALELIKERITKASESLLGEATNSRGEANYTITIEKD